MNTPATDPTPAEPNGPDLAEIREEIDELQEKTTEQLVSPTPSEISDTEPTPEPTDAPGSEDWG